MPRRCPPTTWSPPRRRHTDPPAVTTPASWTPGFTAVNSETHPGLVLPQKRLRPGGFPGCERPVLQSQRSLKLHSTDRTPRGHLERKDCTDPPAWPPGQSRVPGLPSGGLAQKGAHWSPCREVAAAPRLRRPASGSQQKAAVESRQAPPSGHGAGLLSSPQTVRPRPSGSGPGPSPHSRPWSKT